MVLVGCDQAGLDAAVDSCAEGRGEVLAAVADGGNERAIVRIFDQADIACEIVSDGHFTCASGNANTSARPCAILVEDVPENGETV